MSREQLGPRNLEAYDGSGSKPPTKKRVDIEAVAAWAQLLASVAVVIAVPVGLLQLWAISEQIEAMERQSSMDALMRLEDRLNSSDLQSAFGVFRSHKEQIAASDFGSGEDLGNSLRMIANFYELISVSAHKDYLDADDVRRVLGHDLLHFYHRTSSAIETLRERRNQPKIYIELEKLALEIRAERGFEN